MSEIIIVAFRDTAGPEVTGWIEGDLQADRLIADEPGTNPTWAYPNGTDSDLLTWINVCHVGHEDYPLQDCYEPDNWSALCTTLGAPPLVWLTFTTRGSRHHESLSCIAELILRLPASLSWVVDDNFDRLWTRDDLLTDAACPTPEFLRCFRGT